MPETLKNFLKLESAGGIILLCATLLALAIANTPVFLDLFITGLAFEHSGGENFQEIG